MIQRPNIVDNRTPETLVQDGDDIWPDGTDYCPPQFQGAERERFLAEVKEARHRQQATQPQPHQQPPCGERP